MTPMKIAILADIHANLAALHAVIDDIDTWSPDMVIVAGDIVNRGPQSRECLELVLRLRDERGWQVVRGNHEGYILKYDQDHRQPGFPRSGPRYEVSRIIGWTHSQVAHLTSEIARLPEHMHLPTPVGSLAIYHASVRHNRDGILMRFSDSELREQIETEAAVFCTAHTHMPFVRRVDETLLVNVGSVGLPFDGDTRAAYARLTLQRDGWHATIRRVAYDLAQTERIFLQSGMLEAVGAQARIMLRELQTGQSYMFDFVPAYHERIFAGTISVEEAVREFLYHLDHAYLGQAA
jgi:putative phosphoesterase